MRDADSPSRWPPALAPQPRRLLGPGPSNVHPRVQTAMTQPMLGHLDPQFVAIMGEVQRMLREVFCTDNRLTLPVSGTGSAGMEAALVNLIEPGDEVLVCTAGYFALRMCDMVERMGGVLHQFEKPWGETFSTDEVAAALERHPRAELVAIVHGETSTGALQRLDELGGLCRERGRLLLVDAVATLGGVELRVDDWRIDACYSGSQKCLSAPPGLAPLTFGPRAAERLRRRRSKVASWYFDLSGLESYWSEGKRTYHHTAPISMNYALHQALAMVIEEGLENRWARHREHSRALVAGLEALGFRLFAREGARMPVVNAVWIPEGLADEATVRRRLLDYYGIEVAGGLGEVAGKIWRIGLMGESCSRENVVALLEALQEIFAEAGLRTAPDAARRAAETTWLQAARG